MKTLILFTLIAASAVTSAAELEFGLMTHHWQTRGLNENNHLVGVEWRGVEASTFVNSYEDRSYSLGYRVDLGRGWSVSVGAIHGYGENAKWNPLRIHETVFYPSLNYTLPASDRINLRFRFMAHELALVNLVVHI